MNIMKSLFICLMLLLSYPAQSVMAQGQPAKRCEAITKKGTRCKNKAVNKTKYCQVHQAKSPAVMQCKAKTKKGTRCSNAAKISGYCKQHYKILNEGKL